MSRGRPYSTSAGAALARCPRSVHLEGFDDKLASWELIDPDREYSKLRAGLQLVDRRGARRRGGDRRSSEPRSRRPRRRSAMLATVPDPAQALARASELDRFCGEVDIRIAVHVANESAPFPARGWRPWPKARRVRARRAGRKFRCRDEAGRVVCALANFEPIPFKVESLETLSTRCGHARARRPAGASRGVRALPRAGGAPRQAARRAHRRRQSASRSARAAFDAIAAQLQAVHGAMEARGISPGGALALRLFS